MNKKLSLPFKNESSEPVRLCLEPYCEFFLIQPREKVVVSAICSGDASSFEFLVVHNGSFITIYAPGAPVVLVDAYVSLNGEKMDPLPGE